MVGTRPEAIKQAPVARALQSRGLMPLLVLTVRQQRVDGRVPGDVHCTRNAMLLSSLTGLWLWWPLKGGFRRGLRWRRQPTTSANLHHQGGFWIALPLAVLSLTGAWISFPAFFGPLAGDPAGPSPAERMRRMGAHPVAAPRLTAEQVMAVSQPHATGR